VFFHKTQLNLRAGARSLLKEISVNEANLKAALQRQFNGSDTPNDVMWLIK
jgi:hypothetical protein